MQYRSKRRKKRKKAIYKNKKLLDSIHLGRVGGESTNRQGGIASPAGVEAAPLRVKLWWVEMTVTSMAAG